MTFILIGAFVLLLIVLSVLNARQQSEIANAASLRVEALRDGRLAEAARYFQTFDAALTLLKQLDNDHLHVPAELSSLVHLEMARCKAILGSIDECDELIQKAMRNRGGNDWLVAAAVPCLGNGRRRMFQLR